MEILPDIKIGVAIGFCVLVVAPNVLCKKVGDDRRKKRRILTIWGAIAGFFCLLTLLVLGTMTLGVSPGTGTGKVFHGELEWLNDIFNALCYIWPVAAGALIGYMTNETAILSIIWRMVKLFIIMLLGFFVLFVITEFINDPGMFWGALAVIAVLIGLGAKEPGIILIFFK